jgi:hypothetical protein
MQAMKICLDRSLAPLKPQSPTVTLENFKVDGDLMQQCLYFLASVVQGQINPDQGKVLMDMLKIKADLGDTQAMKDD